MSPLHHSRGRETIAALSRALVKHAPGKQGRRALGILVALAGTSGCLAAPLASDRSIEMLPNFVVVLADDLGYGDLGCYGARPWKTPNLDRLAREGMRFTSFYAAQAVCSASRAALLTGCYPNRIGILGALGPKSKTGIHEAEVTLAELLKQRGYATAIFGKWHLGDSPPFLPAHHGFDEFFGLPYSNDMWPRHPSNPKGYPPLPLVEGDRTIQEMPDQTQLTRWYTEHATDFILRNHNRPFFLYVPHSMPHVPLHASRNFAGRSRAGLFGDVIQELDWSVGQILAALKRHRLDERTLVLFISDNGPWLLYGNHAGSAGPLREGKGTSWEGGVRVPCIARWPGQIPRGHTCSELAATIDLLPTLARLAGSEPPRDRVIDGRDIWPLMAGVRGARTPHETFCYYWGQHLQAIRNGRWKLHFPHAYVKPNPIGLDGMPGQYTNPKTDLALFDLDQDIGETRDVSREHPEVVQQLQALADAARADLGDSAGKWIGAGVRSPGKIDNPTGPLAD